MAEKDNILDIINGISQAAANAYDGALDENGEPLKVGLKREEGNPILDKRVMDGFNVTLTKAEKEPNVFVQSLSRYRSLVQASQKYTIGGLPVEPELGQTVEERLNNSIKNWIGFGKDQFPKTKSPENVKVKIDEEPKT